MTDDEVRELWDSALKELDEHAVEFRYARALAIQKAEELLKGLPDGD